MRKESAQTRDIAGADFNLQVSSTQEGELVIEYVTSDGTFLDIESAVDHYISLVKQEKRTVEKLELLIIMATLIQFFQIAQGIASQDYGAFVSIACVAGIMFYIRNKSLRPAIERKKVAELKLELLENYKNPPKLEPKGEETNYLPNLNISKSGTFSP